MKTVSILVFSFLLLVAQAVCELQAASGHVEGQRSGQSQTSTVEVRLKVLTDKLNLTGEQQTKVNGILEDNLAKAQGIMKDNLISRENKMAKIRALREAGSSRIRDLLNANQKKRFDEMQQETRE